MKVLFVAAELSPIVKVGGLGDVIGSLPLALKKAGVTVQVIIPRYGFIPKEGLKLVRRDIVVSLRSSKEKISLYQGKIPGSSIPVFFVDNPIYIGTGDAPYMDRTAFVDDMEEIKRFLFFSKAVKVLIDQKIIKADIVHAHDWHTGALVSMLRAEKPKIRTVFTIHNLGNQGIWKTDAVDAFFLAKEDINPFEKIGDSYNLIAEGIERADWITTVSSTYAGEILTKYYGNGLEEILQRRSGKLTGILNGIDYSFFNPETDQRIFENFSLKTAHLKSINKEALSHAVHFKVDGAPLFGLVSRLTDQKGIDLVIRAMRMFAGKHDARFVFLGTGAKEYEDQLLELQREQEDKVSVHIKFDETLAHRIYAASDFFLMPSRFEPCGLGQMIAMRYGSLPIVRKTGGLADTVEHMRNGFVFEKAIDLSLEKAMRQAYEVYTKDKSTFGFMRKQAMQENFDFTKSALQYKKIYQRILRK